MHLQPLEDAHLHPSVGLNRTTSLNGLLLRADNIPHTLFDLNLLAPEPVSREVAVSKLLIGTEYESLLVPAHRAGVCAATSQPGCAGLI